MSQANHDHTKDLRFQHGGGVSREILIGEADNNLVLSKLQGWEIPTHPVMAGMSTISVDTTARLTKATTTSTSPRRGMLAGTAAALLGAVSLASRRSAAAGGSQDSELLILCAEFHRTQAELDHWHATGFGLEPLARETAAYRLWKAENDRFFWANHDAFEAVRDMPAKTQAGIVAKSKVLAEQMDRVVVNLDGSMRGASNYEIFAYKLVQNTMQIGEARREPMRSA